MEEEKKPKKIEMQFDPSRQFHFEGNQFKFGEETFEFSIGEIENLLRDLSSNFRKDVLVELQRINKEWLRIVNEIVVAKDEECQRKLTK